jgi:hypothetical protein
MRRFSLFALVVGALLALPALAGAAPQPVHAWYMYGTTPGGLESAAYNHACAFASDHPGGTRVLNLDFGAARKIDADTWGALDFSGVRFTNSSILEAMKAAADGHHNCYRGAGGTIVAYGNSNYRMTDAGMTTNDARLAGYYQSYRAELLASYQAASGYNRQSAAAGSDMEPAWDGQLMTKQLVNGATEHGWALYYDFGSADGCPSTADNAPCRNGWGVDDVAYVSFHGSAVPLPQIYYSVNADQWTVVRKWWNTNAAGGYMFWGTTATNGVGLTPEGGWNALSSRNPGAVQPEVTCFC